jgi:hypothetical protein
MNACWKLLKKLLLIIEKIEVKMIPPATGNSIFFKKFAFAAVPNSISPPPPIKGGP